MTHRARATLAVIIAAFLSAGVWTFTPTDLANARQPVPAGAVRMTVLSVTPPARAFPGHRKRALRIVLTLTNTTSETLRGVQVLAARGYPVSSQTALNSSLAGDADTSDQPAIPATRPVTTSLAAGESDTVTFATTTSIDPPSVGLCLCANAIYPINLSAVVGQDGGAATVGTTRTFLPVFKSAVPTKQVSWVWPLLDRPHRLTGSSLFLDDDLAGSVAGGRLDRSLQVVSRVSRQVPLTLVVDPELIDELAVMATGRYSVESTTGTPTAGVGRAPAVAWLGRLRSALTTHPNFTVELTPYADPDLDTLAGVGLSVDPTMPRDMSTRVVRALGDVTLHRDLAWPSGGSFSTAGLSTAAGFGATTVLLDGTSVAPRDANGLPATLSRLRAGTRHVTAALTSPAIQNYASSAVSSTGRGDAVLPQLMSELAVRTDQLLPPEDAVSGAEGTKATDISDAVVITPPRYVDPSVQTAVNAIDRTSSSEFTTPASLSAIVTDTTLTRTAGQVRPLDSSSRALPTVLVSRVLTLSQQLPSVRALLSPSRPGLALVASFPPALQRIESSAWRQDSGAVASPAAGKRLSGRIANEVRRLLASVLIIKPSSGSYTLSSDRSALPITVQNKLEYAARIQIDISVVGGLPGFTAQPVTKVLQPQSRRTIRVPAQVQRSGRIALSAQLRTPGSRAAPGGIALGTSVPLNVHSTFLGTIGVVITVVAAVVLLAALSLRYVRRIQRLRSHRATETKTEKSKTVLTPAAREPAP